MKPTKKRVRETSRIVGAGHCSSVHPGEGGEAGEQRNGTSQCRSFLVKITFDHNFTFDESAETFIFLDRHGDSRE